MDTEDRWPPNSGSMGLPGCATLRVEGGYPLKGMEGQPDEALRKIGLARLLQSVNVGRKVWVVRFERRTRYDLRIAEEAKPQCVLYI